jgi:hypothetical protein
LIQGTFSPITTSETLDDVSYDAGTRRSIVGG